MANLLDLAADTSSTAHPSTSALPGNSLDPSIPLASAGAKPGYGLSQMGDWAAVQTQMTQAQLARQGLAAKIKAGQILASSPDLETGLQGLFKDPTVAPYAGDIVNSIRSSMLAQTQQAGAQQTQALGAWDAVKKGLPALAADPSQATWDSITKPVLAAASPTARASLNSTLGSLQESLLGDLPDDPAQRRSVFQARVAGLAAASPDVWSLMFGKPTQIDVGGQIQPGLVSPTTGRFTPAGGPLAKSLAPQVVHGQGPEGQDITTVMGGSGGARGNGLGGGTGGPPALVGPSLTAANYDTNRTKDIVDYEKNLDDRVYNGSTLRKNMDATIQAAHNASMGGGAQAYMKLGQAMQAIGIKNPTVDKWANGSLAASQVIDKVALQDSMSQLKQQLTGVGGSRLNAQEFVAYLNKNPNLTTDPRAAAEIFQLWNQFYDRDKAEQQAFDKFQRGESTGDQTLDHLAFDTNDLSGKPDIKRWPALWNQSDYMRKFAPGGAIDTSGMKGLGQHPTDISALMKKYGH